MSTQHLLQKGLAIGLLLVYTLGVSNGRTMMTNYTTITEQNQYAYAVGTRLRFSYGAGMGEEYGTITGYDTNQWGTSLIAVTDAGEIKRVNHITTRGVGVYVAEPHEDDRIYTDNGADRGNRTRLFRNDPVDGGVEWMYAVDFEGPAPRWYCYNIGANNIEELKAKLELSLYKG